MAYVHCHGCGWQQDDFWSWKGYNPLRWFFKYDVPTYIRPQMVDFASPQRHIFSWKVLGLRFWKWCNRIYTQQWWTYESWQKAKKEGNGGCPKCGKPLCID